MCYIKNEDPDVPVFNYDPVINPMPAYKNDKLVEVDREIMEENGVSNEELEGFEMPEDFQ